MILLFLNSERSDECIDFTMIITSRNNASISNFGGGFRWKSEYPWCIIQVKSKHFQMFSKKIEKKNDGKTGIFTQNQFSTESIFLYVKFSKTTEIFDFYANFFLKCRVDKIFLAQSKYLKILYKVPYISKFIKLFVFISNVKYSRLTNHLRSESFFSEVHPTPNVQQSGTHLPTFFFFDYLVTYNKMLLSPIIVGIPIIPNLLENRKQYIILQSVLFMVFYSIYSKNIIVALKVPVLRLENVDHSFSKLTVFTVNYFLFLIHKSSVVSIYYVTYNICIQTFQTDKRNPVHNGENIVRRRYPSSLEMFNNIKIHVNSLFGKENEIECGKIGNI
ncbi:hypothetical protein AGLY_007276, partial [Aphis glycines]